MLISGIGIAHHRQQAGDHAAVDQRRPSAPGPRTDEQARVTVAHPRGDPQATAR